MSDFGHDGLFSELAKYEQIKISEKEYSIKIYDQWRDFNNEKNMNDWSVVPLYVDGCVCVRKHDMFANWFVPYWKLMVIC